MHSSMSLPLPSSSYVSSLLQPAPIMMPAPSSSFGASSSRSSIRSRTAAALGAIDNSDNNGADDPYAPHYQLYPRSYTVQRAPYSLWDNIDGDIEKDVWQTVPFSEAFGDIQGDASASASTTGSSDGDDAVPPPLPPIGETRFKALYDDDYLYIAAILHAAATDNMPTIASFTQRNSPIYQKDSDFEVFVDTFHSQHSYKEFEVNAINTIWNLCLDKPYENGGAEHSGRIAVPGQALYYDVNRQATATRIVHGHVNDVHGHGATWTVEMAWSMDDLMQTVGTRPSSPSAASTVAASANDGPTFWRINFSRVERQGDVNWTWQAQTRWDASPKQSRFRGYINMHQPDSWGYLVFAPSSISGTVPDQAHDNWRDPHWPAKLTAMTVYHALQQYKEDQGEYTNRMEALNLPLAIVEPFDIDIDLVAPLPQDNDDDLYFMVTVQSTIDNTAVAVRNDRFMTVLSRSGDDAIRIADSSTVEDTPFNADT